MTIHAYSTSADLNENLMRKLEASTPPTPRKPIKEKQQGRRPDVLLTDEQVLECRARAEFEGWDCERLAETYHTGRRYMRRLLDYETRSKLIPKR